MEKMQWFKFSISEWKMGKIQRCKPEAKSAFIELCCLYWINETKLSIEDAIIECDEDNYQNLLSKKVIKEVDGYVKIYFLDEQFNSVLDKSEKARESVKKRWEKRNTNVIEKNNKSNTNVLETNYESDTNVLQSNYECNTEEKRIEKNRTDKEEEKELTPKNKFSDEVIKLYEYFLNHFEDQYKPKNEKQKNNWLDCIDKLIRIDKLSGKEINEIILNAKNDNFWSSNFLTILKLRESNREGIKYHVIFKNLKKNQKANETRTDEQRNAVENFKQRLISSINK